MLPTRPAAPADAKTRTEFRRVMHDTVDGPRPTDRRPARQETTRHRPANAPAFHTRVTEAADGTTATGDTRSRRPGTESPATAAGFVTAVSTPREYRGRGTGSTLVHPLTGRFPAPGCERVSLFAARQGTPLHHEPGDENLGEDAVAVNRYAGHPLPADRDSAAGTPSGHGTAPVPS